jgi:hypothetical protein
MSTATSVANLNLVFLKCTLTKLGRTNRKVRFDGKVIPGNQDKASRYIPDGAIYQIVQYLFRFDTALLHCRTQGLNVTIKKLMRSRLKVDVALAIYNDSPNIEKNSSRTWNNETKYYAHIGCSRRGG